MQMAPAHHSPVVHDNHGVSLAEAHSCDSAGSQAADFQGHCAEVLVCRHTQLPEVVQSPAVNVAVDGDGARVISTAGNFGV